MADLLAVAKVGYEDGRSCGDEVAKELDALSLDKVLLLADIVCEESRGFHFAKYDHLNNGQKRMNAGNKIRARVRKGADLAALKK